MEKKSNSPMVSCQKATELVEKRAFIKLSIKELAQLHMHNAICSGCRIYEKQSAMLEVLLKKHICVDSDLVTPYVNNPLKLKIISNLK